MWICNHFIIAWVWWRPTFNLVFRVCISNWSSLINLTFASWKHKQSKFRQRNLGWKIPFWQYIPSRKTQRKIQNVLLTENWYSVILWPFLTFVITFGDNLVIFRHHLTWGGRGWGGGGGGGGEGGGCWSCHNKMNLSTLISLCSILKIPPHWQSILYIPL